MTDRAKDQLLTPTDDPHAAESARPEARHRWLPPRWFIRAAWVTHRAVYRITGGRFGLRDARPDRWGTLRLTTVGRRTGRVRTAILGYLEDGSDVVTLAMNGWGDPEPAWWLNLQANPDVTIVLPSGPREVSARIATPDERPRLWAMWGALGQGHDDYAALRSRETAVVILEPRGQRGA